VCKRHSGSGPSKLKSMKQAGHEELDFIGSTKTSGRNIHY
jgi:hypothetical protein